METKEKKKSKNKNMYKSKKAPLREGPNNVFPVSVKTKYLPRVTSRVTLSEKYGNKIDNKILNSRQATHVV